jgi:hypothetical protein
VRIFGHTYRPRLDATRFAGMRAAFGLYGVDYPSVSLWGSEKMYRAKDAETDWPGPFCEGGYFRWDWWHREGEAAS